MSLILVMNKPYKDDRALENVIKYVINGMEDGSIRYASSEDCICYGVNPLTPQTIINSFNMDKRIYNKENGKQVHHFVLTIYKKNYLGMQNKKDWASLLCNEVSYYLRTKGFRNIACIHVAYGGNVHIHFAVNSVNGFTGKKLTNEKYFYNDLIYYLRQNYNLLKWEKTIYKTY